MSQSPFIGALYLAVIVSAYVYGIRYLERKYTTEREWIARAVIINSIGSPLLGFIFYIPVQFLFIKILPVYPNGVIASILLTAVIPVFLGSMSIGACMIWWHFFRNKKEEGRHWKSAFFIPMLLSTLIAPITFGAVVMVTYFLQCRLFIC